MARQPVVDAGAPPRIRVCPALALAGIEHAVGRVDQRGGVPAMFGRGTDADTGTGPGRLARSRLVEVGLDAPCDVLRLFQCRVGKHGEELVSAVVAKPVAVALHLAQPRHHPDQCPVAGAVAELVVDRLEAVQVDHEKAERRLFARVGGQVGLQRGTRHGD